MSELLEYGGVFGILVLGVLITMVVVALHGLWESLFKKAKHSGAAAPRADQQEMFDTPEYEAVIAEAGEKDYALSDVADLVQRMQLDTSFSDNGLYVAEQEGSLRFYIADGMGKGRLDDLERTTSRLAFILPLPTVSVPTRSFDLMVAAAVDILRELGGTLKDEKDQGQVLSKQGIDHMRERVRHWELEKRRGAKER